MSDLSFFRRAYLIGTQVDDRTRFSCQVREFGCVSLRSGVVPVRFMYHHDGSEISRMKTVLGKVFCQYKTI